MYILNAFLRQMCDFHGNICEFLKFTFLTHGEVKSITGAIIGYSWKLCELVQLLRAIDNIDSVCKMANYLSQMSYSQESMCKKISCRSSQVGVIYFHISSDCNGKKSATNRKGLPIQGWLDKFQRYPYHGLQLLYIIRHIYLYMSTWKENHNNWELAKKKKRKTVQRESISTKVKPCMLGMRAKGIRQTSKGVKGIQMG